MITIFKNKPISQNNKLYNTILYLLTVLATVPMLMPVVVGFQSDFTRIEVSVPYLIFRGLAALSIILGVNIFVINKNTSFFSLAGILTAVAVIFPLVDGISTLYTQISFSVRNGMHVDLSQYILTVVEYSIFFILSILTALYALGFFRFPVAVMALSVPAAIAAQYDVIDRAVRMQYGTYDILCFAYSVTLSLIPLVLVLSCKTSQKAKSNKYTARRYA